MYICFSYELNTLEFLPTALPVPISLYVIVRLDLPSFMFVIVLPFTMSPI